MNPTNAAREAYEDAKRQGKSDTEAWWAAYEASPFNAHSNAHADAYAAQKADNETHRQS